MTRTGTIVRVSSNPRGFVLLVPASPGPPPEPATEVTYLCDADAMHLAALAKCHGSTVDVEGTAPACGGVTLR